MSRVEDTNVDAAGLWVRVQQALGVQSAPEMASLLGVSKQAAYEWQKGKLPGLDMLLRIAAVKGVSIHWIVTGRGHTSIMVVDENDLKVVEELAEEVGASSDEQIGELVREALQSRGLVAVKKSKTLDAFMSSFDKLTPADRRRAAARLIRELATKHTHE